MLAISNGPDGKPLSAVVLVAFDSAKGDVLATYVHGYFGDLEKGEVEQASELLLGDVRGRVGDKANIEVIQVPIAELDKG
jgi:hypothetical protein